jgi:hypothetical protein
VKAEALTVAPFQQHPNIVETNAAMQPKKVTSSPHVRGPLIIGQTSAFAVPLAEDSDEGLSDGDSIDVSSTDDPDSLKLLVQILLEEESSAGAEVRRSTIGSRLQKENPVRFNKKGKAGEVLKEAEHLGIVRLGGEKGTAWCKRVLK